MSMFTEEEKMGFIRDLNAMNEQIELSEKMLKAAEERLKDMRSNHNAMVQLRDLYVDLLKSADEA